MDISLVVQEMEFAFLALYPSVSDIQISVGFYFRDTMYFRVKRKVS